MIRFFWIIDNILDYRFNSSIGASPPRSNGALTSGYQFKAKNFQNITNKIRTCAYDRWVRLMNSFPNRRMLLNNYVESPQNRRFLQLKRKFQRDGHFEPKRREIVGCWKILHPPYKTGVLYTRQSSDCRHESDFELLLLYPKVHFSQDFDSSPGSSQLYSREKCFL